MSRNIFGTATGSELKPMMLRLSFTSFPTQVVGCWAGAGPCGVTSCISNRISPVMVFHEPMERTRGDWNM